MVMRCLRIALALTLFSPAAIATAQDPGVTYDPDSPAGREYEIPLESARREAGGGGTDGPRTTASEGSGSAGTAQGSGEAPLFGVGITPRTKAASPPSGGGGAGGAGTGGTTSPPAPAPGTGSTSLPRVAAPAAAVTAARNASGEQTQMGLLLLALAGAAVGGVALLLRRRRSGASG